MRTLLIGLVVTAACGDSGPPKMKTVDLGTTGYVIDVPEGWTVESPMEGFFEFEGGRPRPQVMTSAVKPDFSTSS